VVGELVGAPRASHMMPTTTTAQNSTMPNITFHHLLDQSSRPRVLEPRG
jgi:hypothetical protein